MTKSSTPYATILNKHLKGSEQAIAYLNAAIEEGDPDLFLIALQNVATAQGTPLPVASANPSLDLQNILHLLCDAGLVLTFRDDRKAS
jgi:hypothetical protein